MATVTTQPRQLGPSIPLQTIPLQLLEAPRWVVWKLEPDPTPEDPDHTTKVPYNAKTGRLASTTDPSTWSTFQIAQKRMARGGYTGLGFVLGEGIAGVDLDHCVTDDILSAEASQVVEAFDTYAEISPSGTGVHIYLLGAWKDAGSGRKRGNYEAYGHARFFTVTGNSIPGIPGSVEARQEQFDAFVTHYLPRPENCHFDKNAHDGGTLDLEDAQVCLRAASSPKDGPRFYELWDGGNDGLKSNSEGDLALCGILARAGAGDDQAQIDRIFRTSKRPCLENGKWDKNDRTYGSYGARTIAKAVLTSGSQFVDRPPVEIDTEIDAEIESQNVKMTNSGEGETLYWRRRAERAEARIAELEKENSLLKRTYANTNVSPTLRAGADCLRREWVKKAVVNPTTGKKELLLFKDGVAKAAGVSPKTLDAIIQNYEIGGHLQTRPVKKVSEFGPNKGKRMDRIVVELDEDVFLEHPERLTSSSLRKPGGSVICPGCQKRHLKAKTTYTCLECGTVWESAERYLHPDQEYGENESENVKMTNFAEAPADSAEGVDEGDDGDFGKTSPISTVRRVPQNDKKPPNSQNVIVTISASDPPQEPCYTCKGRRWSRRSDGRWLCENCRPSLQQRQEVS